MVAPSRGHLVPRRRPERPRASSSPSSSQQRWRWHGQEAASSGGFRCPQTSIAYVHRGWNRHPSGVAGATAAAPGSVPAGRPRHPTVGRSRADPRCTGAGDDRRARRPAPARRPGLVHHDHVLGDLGDNAEIVRDHDDRHSVLLLETVHERKDLRLCRHVERVVGCRR